jgi:hypothetical protein
VSNELHDYARRVALLPGALVEGTSSAVRAGAEVLEEAARVEILAATGGDMRLSRVRSGKGATIALRTRVDGAGRSARGVVVPTGPIMLVENDTRGHRQPFDYAGVLGAGGRRRYATAGQQLVGGGTARRRRAARSGVVVVPGYGPRSRVRHPGTSGKRPLGKAWDRASADAGRAGVAVFGSIVTEFLAQGRWNAQRLGIGG